MHDAEAERVASLVTKPTNTISSETKFFAHAGRASEGQRNRRSEVANCVAASFWPSRTIASSCRVWVAVVRWRPQEEEAGTDQAMADQSATWARGAEGRFEAADAISTKTHVADRTGVGDLAFEGCAGRRR